MQYEYEQQANPLLSMHNYTLLIKPLQTCIYRKIMWPKAQSSSWDSPFNAMYLNHVPDYLEKSLNKVAVFAYHKKKVCGSLRIYSQIGSAEVLVE